ncbi:hypothetical protein [Actinomadura alba]|uniref:DUF4190 domain-containing protein n=1 Tax=Actinomadura alba TaxID=406431 RepID=A0ABR7LLS4_9ACTN|nr:hypothetical protein [Actinomadura alba]MBC6465633.1 hypothetical protein [Actinomadura alba]
MSGYGGQPPGWQDPYGQGYGPPGVPHGSSGSGSAIGAMICNILFTVLCCNLLAIPGIVTSAIAVNRFATDPESARSLTAWSWVIFAANVVIVITAIVVLILIGGFDSGSSSSDF